MILAKNYAKTGVLANENNLNITLAPSLIRKEGHPLVMSEYLGSFFYAQIFKIIGLPDYNNLILFSVILYALILVLFTILTLYLFNFKIAIVFSLIYIFSPVGWGLPRYLGSYEFCLIFWALFFVFYFLGVKRTEQSKNKFNNLFFIISGIFLALSGLSKEVSFIFALAFFIFLLVRKLKQQLMYVFIPFIILIIIFWLPSVISGQNRYISLSNSQAKEESIFSVYLHVFPDPYTYYFEKEEFLEKFREEDLGWSENLETKKVLTNFGFDKPGIIDRFRVGIYILSQHFFRFFSLEDIGGPFIAMLLILGMVYLRNKYKFLYKLALYWLAISFLVFAFIILASRNHLMDFIWLLSLLTALGLFYLIYIIKEHFKLEGKILTLFGVLITALVLYHLILVNHVVLGKEYDKDFVPRSMVYAREIKELEISDADVIAIPSDFSNQINTLNYLTDKSFVIFRAPTLERLLKEGEIKNAFEAFKVRYILGYPDQLSKEIIKQTPVINIASSSIKIELEQVSESKSFFMNLIR